MSSCHRVILDGRVWYGAMRARDDWACAVRVERASVEYVERYRY